MKTIRDAYFTWLNDQVDPEGQHSILNRFIHDVWLFRWTIPMDKNREVDGYDLRNRFLQACGDLDTFTNEEVSELKYPEVSVFEVMVAICFRMEFELDDLSGRSRVHIWFTELLNNLDLLAMANETWIANGEDSELIVGHIVEKFLDRTYDWDGRGSLFPVEYSVNDMRDVEIWYQMMLYLNNR